MGAGGGDEVVRRHHALVDVGRRCSVVSLGGALGSLPLIPVMRAYNKHAQMEQEGDFVAPPFWRK